MSAAPAGGRIAATTAQSPLFQRLLAQRFAMLPPAVQRLHLKQGRASYHGEVQVERGTGGLSRLCAWATRLPPAGRGPVVVDIESEGACERWTRHIGGHAMRSRLWAADGLLCEQLGLVTFGFRLDVESASLTWTVARVRVFGVPLPVSMFARVAARESEVDGRYTFDVRAALPLAGDLVHYRGWLDVA
ncbi:DUF4166 domain-containing protein [Lysobacter korlensis]|uniref:DUF4166 domain-containing protein n=1 Tax=Lysobacter korlensis TaxID=553636 RepID=A0ABV6RIE5_9GAMM